jgi:potassium-dependent mechanosensitive channel
MNIVSISAGIKKILLVTILICCSLFSTIGYAQDTLKKPGKHRFDMSLFADSNTLSSSDYLSALQRVFEVQNKVPVVTGSFSNMDMINRQLQDDDAAIALVKDKLTTINERTLNLQNLQMFAQLLRELNDNVKDDNEELNKYDTSLSSLKLQILNIRKDTVLHHIFKDSLLKAAYMPQILELRKKWKITDSLVRLNTTLINNLKAHASTNAINIQELLFRAEVELKTLNTKAFAKERRYLWEPRNVNKPNFIRGFHEGIDKEQRITSYYFKNTRSNRLSLYFISGLFFFLVWYNFRSLKRLNKLDELAPLKLQYIHAIPFLSSMVLLFSIAPLFDMNAPVIYTESIQFLLLVTLTLFFIKRLSRPLFLMWCGYLLFFLLPTFFRLLGLPIYMERWWTLTINIGAIVYALFIMLRLGNTMYRYKFIWAVGILFVLLHMLSIVCNVLGRVSLSHILLSAALYAFAQAVSLTILVQIIVEAFLLQIKSSRIRRKYPDHFESGSIIKGITRMVSIFAVVLWCVIFADNVNLYEPITADLLGVLGRVHSIGNFSFTLGGIALFLGIIWFANFLQKYISYFFGDIGDDALVENKTERSRLLVTRLILLIVGFLLAVAASGLPIDKITVILGALGVGIGLGLQSIVNNFVSGIILIFDRTLRIGDVVEVSDKKGRVKEIGIRTSTLITEDGAEVVIPNGDVLSKNITNWTLSNNHVRITISLSVSKPYNMDELMAICQDEILENENVFSAKAPEIFITAITPTSAVIKIFFWGKHITRIEQTYSEVYTAIYARLEDVGVKLL